MEKLHQSSEIKSQHKSNNAPSSFSSTVIDKEQDKANGHTVLVVFKALTFLPGFDFSAGLLHHWFGDKTSICSIKTLCNLYLNCWELVKEVNQENLLTQNRLKMAV